MPAAIINEHDEKYDRKAQEALLKKVRSLFTRRQRWSLSRKIKRISRSLAPLASSQYTFLTLPILAQRYEDEPRDEHAGNTEQRNWEDDQMRMASLRTGRSRQVLERACQCHISLIFNLVSVCFKCRSARRCAVFAAEGVRHCA